VHIYLDANVYNDVVRGSISSDEVETFRTARARGGIETRLGLPDLEEFLGVWDTDRPTALRRLCIARDLVGFDGLLKQPSDILEETIRAYAAGSATPSPLMPRPDRRHHAAVLHKIARGSTKYDRMMSQILADVKANKESFKARMARGSAGLLEELTARYSQRELSALPFADFFGGGAADWAAALADRKGLADACRERGLAGLLRVRTVRLCVGVVMSQIHTEISAGRKPDLGDGYDIWHAILASTADVFITSDQRFFDHLARVPDVNGFRVVKSLGKALAPAE
jgi:hypothetical protein